MQSKKEADLKSCTRPIEVLNDGILQRVIWPRSKQTSAPFQALGWNLSRILLQKIYFKLQLISFNIAKDSIHAAIRPETIKTHGNQMVGHACNYGCDGRLRNRYFGKPIMRWVKFRLLVVVQANGALMDIGQLFSSIVI